MNRPSIMTIPVLMLAASFRLAGLAAATPENSGKTLVVVLSPYLRDKAATLSAVTKSLVTQQEAAVHVLDGADGITIAQFTVPKLAYFKEEAVAARLREPLKLFSTWQRRAVADANLADTGALALPMVLERISHGLGIAPNHLVLVGSPIFCSSDLRFDFRTPRLRYPSDAHLADPSSPFFSQGVRETSLRETAVHYLFPGEDITTWPLHYEERLRGFYSAFFSARGGSLVSFTPDLAIGLKAVGSRIASHDRSQLASPIHHAGPAQMLDAQQPEPPIDQPALPNAAPAGITTVVGPPAAPPNPEPEPAQPSAAALPRSPDSGPALAEKDPEENLPVIAATPPSAADRPVSTPGVLLVPPSAGVIIGIKFQGRAVDADLYVTPHRGAPELSYRHPGSALGSYSSTVDLESGGYFKWVNLPGGVEAMKAEVWLNYSRGSGPLTGSVVWIRANGQRNELPFAFRSTQAGDTRHRKSASRERSPHWLRVDLGQLTASPNR